MASDTSSELETAAHRLVAEATTPIRRARPRLSEPLYEAEDREVQTPSGPVMAWRLGQGPAVLLVHGWEDDNALWGPMIARLQSYGRPVVALDLPGHGHSPAELTRLEDASAAILAVSQALGPIEAVIGHSFGCAALAEALDHGLQAQSAVMIASPIPQGRARWIERELKRGAPAEVVARALEILSAREEEVAPRLDYLAAASRMSARALFIHSLDDEQCPPDNSQRLAGQWPGAEILWADGLGHRLIAQDGDITQAAADFIEGLPWPR